MATKGVSGFGLSMVAAGAYIIYLGIKGTDALTEFRKLARGERPEPLSRTSKSTALRGPTGGDFGGGDFGGQGNVVGNSTSGQAVANAALSHVGTPYKWGGASPAGMDCSGMVFYVFVHDVGVPAKGFPRTTAAEIASPLFRKVPRGQIMAGDLTWWPGHVGIAINNEQGVYAPSPGRKVQIQTIDRPRVGFVGLRYFGPGIPIGRGGKP
jgi:peptidoglycan DL-endopeptidase CwlO